MTGRLALIALEHDAGGLIQELSALGWDATGDGMPDVRLLIAADAGALPRHLKEGWPTLCLATVGAEAESTLLRAGAHMVLPLDTAATAVAAALSALARLAAPGDRALRVGDLALHVDRRLAWCRGRPLALAPLDFDLLVLLAERPGQVVPAAELRARLWPDATDSAGRLTAHIRSLRRALGPAAPLHTRGHQGYVLGGVDPKR
ncbi:winged helix-turn-helix domain-containing protein [Nitrospirillum sp. BR 11163]|uniref:winged helix-turn-helix domain-containing protein n=1 Tax=Nitrospirillum sp. BR 11163 TaxID=3104323 RepID=UPI002AFFCB03|nr:winged helix-turn-helix domain-containing protein [Nitrospirillum sp. BR 11163]MEA1677698.1 winged helix-turn-helix domain-containing protein [Nitrospirillum sp. BR 11163]